MSTSINGTTGIDVSAVSSSAITADRTSTDGTIIDLQKDGTSVGAISSVNSASIIVYGDTGIRFGGDGYLPVDSSGSLTDNAADFGNSSYRYKDLYLGGGVYLGGTGSSNLLQDYETGTFTPTAYGDATAGTTTYVAQQGLYTKVGRQVSIVLFVGWSAMTGTGSVRIGGLPFTAANLSQNYAPFTTLPSDINWSGGTAYVALQMQNTDYMYLYGQNDDGGSSPQAVVNETGTIRISGTYIAA